MRVTVEQRPGRQEHARRAEAALQAVLGHEALLHRVEGSVLLETLDGLDRVTGDTDREDGAGLGRLAVEQNDAGAAVGRVASPVRAGQPERVAEEVDEQRAWLGRRGHLLPVHGQADVHGVGNGGHEVLPGPYMVGAARGAPGGGRPAARAVASRSALTASSPATCRL